MSDYIKRKNEQEGMSMAKHYSMEVEAEGTAKALGYEFTVSPKDSYEVCKAIRGMMLPAAKKYLEDVLDHKKAISFTRYNGKIKHRVGKIGPGGYPEKATQYVLDVLKNAENNAEYKGMDPDNMFIMHSAANRGRQLKGRMPRAHGRSTEWNEQTTSIEIIIKEKEEKKEKKTEAKKEEKKAEAKAGRDSGIGNRESGIGTSPETRAPNSEHTKHTEHAIAAEKEVKAKAESKPAEAKPAEKVGAKPKEEKPKAPAEPKVEEKKEAKSAAEAKPKEEKPKAPATPSAEKGEPKAEEKKE